jgi:homoserine kinase
MARPWVRARAPATIANVGPGFDVFCLAVRGVHDDVSIRVGARDSIVVSGEGAGSLPVGWSENTAGIVLDALRRRTGIRDPLEVRIGKGIPPARGLGSSAASAAGAAIAFLKAFPKARSLAPADILEAAVEGEAAVSGRHYDNVAGALLGGFVSIASTAPLVLRREPVSERIHLALAVPDLPLRTAEMRAVLPRDVSLEDAVSNVGKAATLALALVRGDAVLAGRCLEDRIATPVRAPFLAGYADVRDAALRAGATGVSISGSGSSVFGLAATRARAERSAKAMADAFRARGTNAKGFAARVDNSLPLAGLSSIRGPSLSLVTP